MLDRPAAIIDPSGFGKSVLYGAGVIETRVGSYRGDNRDRRAKMTILCGVEPGGAEA